MPVNYFNKAKTCMELCRFSYKMFAQTVAFPFDPFFEADARNTNNLGQITRKRMMAHIHDTLGTRPGTDIRKFDPIQYRLTAPPNPELSVVYRGETDNRYLVLPPGTWDRRIGAYAGFDLRGTELAGAAVNGGNCRCGYFQGKTGMTAQHPNSGWPSFLGAAIFDPDTHTLYIAFRGSRSGNGFRALTRAQIYSEGNPDWVTDMNHLKEQTPFNPGFGPPHLKLATGFWKAYVSANLSMEAAIRYAIRGGNVRAVCVTGHSLGGALAQSAYLHLCHSPRIKNRVGLDPNVVIECYPMAAPPICLGVESQHWVSRNANASNVHHFFCPYDAVHACSLVLTSGATVGTKVTGARHPLTTPYHFGSQVALDSAATFPDAHEPLEIWKGMWRGVEGENGVAPTGFWQTVELDTLNSRVRGTVDDPIAQQDIHQALVDSFRFHDFIQRARDWAEGISKTGNREPAVHCIDEVARLYSSDNYQNNYGQLQNQRDALIATINRSIAENSSDTAGCVYHTLKVAIGIKRLIRDINR